LIISRYIAREISQAMAAALTVLLLIYVSNHFVRILGEVDTGHLQANVVVTMLAMRILSSLSILLPLALFLAVLLAFGRFYKDNEAVAMEACGISPRTGLHAVMGFASVIAVLVAVCSLLLVPWSEEQIYQIRDQQQAASVWAGLISGRFVEPRHGPGVIYAERFDARTQSMDNVFIEGLMAGPDHRSVVLVARSGRQQSDPRSGGHFLILNDGYRYEGTPGQPDYRITQFNRHALRLSAPPVSRSSRKHRALGTGDLLRLETPADIAELQWRVAMPISTLLLGLLAVPLSRTKPRQGRYARLFVAILVYFAYSNLLSASQTWVEQGTLPPLVGLWWVHICLAVLIWVLLARQYGHGWLLRALHLKRVH
jgi:lipopolysaccharide export system permease protein